MDCDAESLAFGRDLETVAQGQVRISGERDQLVGQGAMLARGELRDGIPLFRSWLEADFAVGSDALAVQDDFDSAQFLVAENFVKRVLVGEHAQSLRLEVIQVVQMEVGRQQRVGTPQREAGEACSATAMHAQRLILRIGSREG